MTELSLIDRYRACFEATWTDETPIDQVRFVVLDSETTGLNPRTDRIITVGAVGVRGHEVLLEDSFDALLTVADNTEAVMVHGITRDETRGGVGEEDALAHHAAQFAGDGAGEILRRRHSDADPRLSQSRRRRRADGCPTDAGGGEIDAQGPRTIEAGPHTVGAGHDHPIVPVDLPERAVERSAGARAEDADRWRRERLCAQFSQPLAYFVALRARARH